MPALHWIAPSPGSHVDFLSSVIPAIEATRVYSAVHRDMAPMIRGDHIIYAIPLSPGVALRPDKVKAGLTAGYFLLPSGFVDPQALLEWMPQVDLAFTSGGMGLGAMHNALGQLRAPPAEVYTRTRAATALYPAGPILPPLLSERITGVSRYDHLTATFGGADPRGIYFASRAETPYGIDDLLGCFNALCAGGLSGNPYLLVQTMIPETLRATLAGYPDIAGRVFLSSKDIASNLWGIDYVLGVDHLDPWPQYLVDAMSLGVPVACRDDHVYTDIGTDDRALLLPTPLFSRTGDYYRNGLDTSQAAAAIIADLKGQTRWTRAATAQQWAKNTVGTPEDWAQRILSRMGMI